MKPTIDKFGRVTLPKLIRDHLGMHAGAMLVIKEQGDAIIIKLAQKKSCTTIENGLLIYTGKPVGDFQQTLDEIRNDRLEDF